MQAGLTAKGELAELLDTLIDLQQLYPPSAPNTTPVVALHQRLHSLLPLLLSGYGATLSSPDQSLLRVLLHINDIVYQSPEHQQAQRLHQEAAVTSAAATAAAAAAAIPSVTMTNGDAGTDNGDAADAAGGAAGDADNDVSAEEEDEVVAGPITAMLHGPLATAG